MDKLMISQNGQPVRVYWHEGRPCWRATELSRALGYAHNHSLGNLIAQMPDLAPGDTTVLEGQDLRDFKAIQNQNIKLMLCMGRKVRILFEPGLHKLLMHCKRPAAKAFRDKFAEHVSPQLARDGRYSPDRTVTAEGEMVEKVDIALERHLQRLEEKRLDHTHALAMQDGEIAQQQLTHDLQIARIVRSKRIDAMTALKTRRTYGGEQGLLSALQIAHIMQQEVELAGAEGIQIDNAEVIDIHSQTEPDPVNTEMPPRAEILATWQTATELGVSLGVSAKLIGGLAKKAGLKEEPHACLFVTTTKHHKEVAQWRYGPGAAATLSELVGQRKAKLN